MLSMDYQASILHGNGLAKLKFEWTIMQKIKW